VVNYDGQRDAFRLAQKRLSGAEAKGARTPDIKVSLASSASAPKDPTMPPPIWVISILSIALGLFLAITTVFVAGYLDRTLDTPGEAERELGLPVLATIQNERGYKHRRRRR
jgi:capsular polysaccharide biosynthesis protein